LDDYRNESAHEEITKVSPSEASFEQVISYNLSEAERPGGLKVRFKVKVATGKQAAALDARQAEAIRGLLSWARQYRAEQGQLPGSR
jgi:hypothetical protein